MSVVLVRSMVLMKILSCQQQYSQQDAEEVVEAWLGDDSPFQIEELSLSSDEVRVELAGPGEPPPTQRLARDMANDLDEKVTVEVRVVPESKATAVPSAD